ncbi:hypothetical protein GCM10009030_11520 [Haloarcula pellucida]|uniref:Uncharacterized protein n=1 Tax=Haloarcula pellucida TaxID=1427151 RepID=A0A830GJG4_9EURY|nr:hypothetical protein GCM10009030_11520 [Halomicroarcula pellucida]
MTSSDVSNWDAQRGISKGSHENSVWVASAAVWVDVAFVGVAVGVGVGVAVGVGVGDAV